MLLSLGHSTIEPQTVVMWYIHMHQELLSAWPRGKPGDPVCVCVCAAAVLGAAYSSSLHLISPQFFLWTICSCLPLFILPPFTPTKVSVLSLWGKVARAKERPSPWRVEGRELCPRAHEPVSSAWLFSVCSSSHPLIKLTGFINSLWLMHRGSTPPRTFSLRSCHRGP